MLIKIIENKNVQTIFLFIIGILALIGIKYITELYSPETECMTIIRLSISGIMAYYMGAIIHYNRNK